PISEELRETSLKLISEDLDAPLQRDSCILQEQGTTQHLGSLCLSELQAQPSQAPPFVYDDEYLYLYRYWQLEQRLAQQVIRLKQQKIPAIDLEDFDDLLSDIHQKNALKMVAENAFNIITGGPGTGKTYTLARIIAVL